MKILHKYHKDLKKIKNDCNFLDLTGGKALINTSDELTKFYKDVAECLKKKKNLYIVEKPSKQRLNWFFIDVDIKVSSEEEGKKYDIQFMKRFMKDLYEFCETYFYFENPLKIILCSTKIKSYKGAKKVGYHLIFRNLCIEHPLLKCFMKNLKEHIKTLYEEKIVEAVDEAANGLRMCYMHKNFKDKTFYKPELIFSNSEQEEIINHEDLYACLRLSSIFPPEFNIMSNRQKLYLSMSEDDKVDIKKGFGFGKYSSGKVMMEHDSKYTQKLYKHLTYLYMHNMPKVYAGHVTFILKLSDIVYVFRTNNRYCGNKEGFHKSENPYFVLKPTGIVQKCFCSCEDERKYGKCKEFASRLYKITTDVFDLFFPGKTQYEKFKINSEKSNNIFPSVSVSVSSSSKTNNTDKNIKQDFLEKSLNTLNVLQKKYM